MVMNSIDKLIEILSHFLVIRCYHGLMFDSTPDLAHREQMSEVVRYAEIDFEKKTVCIKESFLGFIQLSDKDAASLAQTILEQLGKDDMNVENCRSQCYDNAAVMAGHKSDVNQRVKKKSNLAIFVNCDNHSLNLVGVHAAKEEVMKGYFFWNHRQMKRNAMQSSFTIEF